MDNGPFSAKTVAARASGPGWAREYELANLTAIPYLLNKEYWQTQKMLVILNASVSRDELVVT